MTQHIDAFDIIGITIRTNNSNPHTLLSNMQTLWGKFISENIQEQIPNKLDNSIYCIYTEYESDYTGDYTAFLGCKVSNLINVPTGLTGKSFNAGFYKKFVTRGDLNKGVVYNTWQQIWNSDLNRAYVADFEVYNEQAHNPENTIVEIFVGLKARI